MSLLGWVTLALALATTVSVCFTAKMARKTSDLAEGNEKLIEQGDKQHRERLRPYCVALTNRNETIADFEAVVGKRKSIPGMLPGVNMDENAEAVWVIIANQGLGPALNVRFHFNDIHLKRISKDFLVQHILPPGSLANFLSQIPREQFTDAKSSYVFYEPSYIVDNIYFLVCEYQSIFGEDFHSIVAKGYLDPALTNDGMNNWRLLRPRTPPVEFMEGRDPAHPIWHVPQPTEPPFDSFLNLPSSPKEP